MLKRIALICTLAILFSGCSLPLPHRAEEPNAEKYVDSTKYIHEYRENLQYQQLGYTEQNAYGQIYTAIRDNEQTDCTVPDANGQQQPGIRIPLADVQFSREQMSHLFETFFRDNPRFFYLSRTYSLEGYELNGQTVYDTLLLQFTMDADERETAIDAFNRALTSLLAQCPKTDDDYEIELFLHDRLLQSCTYDNQAAASSSDTHANAYSAYGALIEGKAVCEGYAKAMQILLNAAAIPTTVVLGNAVEDGEPHMWNLTKINGQYYYLDPTWNDDDAGDRVLHTYFNITTDMLLRTHTPEKDAYAIKCSALTDNYHHRNATFIDTYERDAIAEVIAAAVQAGDTTIELRFADGKCENALLFLKNLTITQQRVNKFLSKKTMWDYELLTQIEQNAITICKK